VLGGPLLCAVCFVLSCVAVHQRRASGPLLCGDGPLLCSGWATPVCWVGHYCVLCALCSLVLLYIKGERRLGRQAVSPLIVAQTT
jgi:hypothetical protein